MTTQRLAALIIQCALLCVSHSAASNTFCSKLDFAGVTWSPAVATSHRMPFSLALNITGSFEGDDGWSNLANNFDGMGFSLGLLNQNLGVGTLQPLFLEIKNHRPRVFSGSFSAANYVSLAGMLEEWDRSPPIKANGLSNILRDSGFSDLDDPELVAEDLGMDPADLMPEAEIFAVNRNTASVNWAKATLFVDKQFKEDWKTQLKAAAETPEYRSIQVAEAETLHQKALELYRYFRMTQLRSYLFFFDIVVQNGGLPDSVKSKYNRYVLANPKSTEGTRLKKILLLRLPFVRRKYRDDVRRRKMSIIYGKGRVHGHDRNYNVEYCLDIRTPLPN